MKILRRHHGFTTNSSSASEWIDPESPPASIPLDQFDAHGVRLPQSDGEVDLLNEDSAPATISLDGWTPTPRPGEQSRREVQPEKSSSPPRKDVASENVSMLIAFVGSVLGLFALERIIRRSLRARKNKEEE